MIDLSVLINRYSLDCQHGRPDRRPANVGCSNFGYTNKDQSNNSIATLQQTKCKKDNKKFRSMLFQKQSGTYNPLGLIHQAKD